LDGEVNYQFFPATRMLRNGRYLVDRALTAAYSTIEVTGGYANTTFSTEFDNDPTADELNIAVLSILNADLMAALIPTVAGLAQAETLTVASYVPVPDDVGPGQGQGQGQGQGENGEQINGDSTPTVLWSLAGIFVALGAGYFAHKKGAFKKASTRYNAARSNLRLNTLKSNSGNADGEFLVEVGTDEMEEGMDAVSPSNSNDTTDTYHSAVMCSPSSVKGVKQKAEEKKTIDPSAFTVEIGTE